MNGTRAATSLARVGEVSPCRTSATGPSTASEIAARCAAYPAGVEGSTPSDSTASARAAPAFDLVSLGPFPGMVAGGHAAVSGERHDVDPATLAALDRLEGHPRLPIHTTGRLPIRLEDGALVEAYLLPKHRADRRPRIPSGDWKQHQPRKERRP
jgi:gamma-glutamylcyclotransferase (GGCT)/AIG2-like uncharacterized protein YtfP